MSKSKRMGRVHYWACRSILLLDRLPRYGRVYEYRPGNPYGTPREFWMYQKRGLWGFYLLDRVGWLGLFITESEYRAAVKERRELTKKQRGVT